MVKKENWLKKSIHNIFQTFFHKISNYLVERCQPCPTLTIVGHVQPYYSREFIS